MLTSENIINFLKKSGNLIAVGKGYFKNTNLLNISFRPALLQKRPRWLQHWAPSYTYLLKLVFKLPFLVYKKSLL